MSGFKAFDVKQKFNSTEEFYNYLLQNINFSGKSMGIKIENFSKDNPFCIVGKERIASRGRRVDGVGLCEQDEQDNPKTRLSRATKQRNTERNLLLFASKSQFPESLEELITLSEAFDFDIIVYFVQKECGKTHMETLSWLQKICNSDTQFIVSEADF